MVLIKKLTSAHEKQNTKCREEKGRIWKASKENDQVVYKCRPIRIIPYFSMETQKAKGTWVDVMQTLRYHRCQYRLPYPTKISITMK